MRYGVIATKMRERLAFAAQRVPIPMLDALIPLVQTRSLLAAVRFGVFETLRDDALSAAQIAERCRLDPEATLGLLRVLVFAGYVRQRRETFALTRLARRTVLADAPLDTVGYLRFNYTQWALFDDFETMLESGRGIDLHAKLSPAAQRDYLMGMVTMARPLAKTAAREVFVKTGATHLLDVGGAHGMYAAALCRLHPGLRATVLDVPETLSLRQVMAENEKIDDVVTHVAGDAMSADFGSRDVVFIGNLLHHLRQDDARQLLRRAYEALTADGTLAIWESEQPSLDAKADYVDALALYFKLTSSGRCYEGREMAGWLAALGCKGVKTARPLLAPGFVLVSGRRPG